MAEQAQPAAGPQPGRCRGVKPHRLLARSHGRGGVAQQVVLIGSARAGLVPGQPRQHRRAVLGRVAQCQDEQQPRIVAGDRHGLGYRGHPLPGPPVRVGPEAPQRHVLEREQRLVDVPVLAHLVGHLGERGQRPGAGPGGGPHGLAGPGQPEPVPRFQVQRLGLIQQPQRRLHPAQVVERPRGADQPLPALGRTRAKPGRGGQRRGLFRDRPAAEGPVRGRLQPSGHLLVRPQAGRRPVPHLTVRHARQHLRQRPVHGLPPGQPGRLTHRRPHQRMPEPHALPVHLGQPRRHRRAPDPPPTPARPPPSSPRPAPPPAHPSRSAPPPATR